MNTDNTTKSFDITLEDVEISNNDIEGWLVATDNGITVALDTTLTPDLINEGYARELVSKIQNLRKDSGFDVTDRINISICFSSGVDIWENGLITKKEYICSETLANDIILDQHLAPEHEIDFLDDSVRIKVERI